jgi:hypothetical protein
VETACTYLPLIEAAARLVAELDVLVSLVSPRPPPLPLAPWPSAPACQCFLSRVPTLFFCLRFSPPSRATWQPWLPPATADPFFSERGGAKVSRVGTQKGGREGAGRRKEGERRDMPADASEGAYVVVEGID